MKKLVILFLFILLTACGTKWTRGDKVLGLAFVGGQVINYGQMRWNQEQAGWHEINPMVANLDGVGETLFWKGLTTLSVFFVADMLPSGWRRGFLGGCNVLLGGLIIHDINAGVGWKP